ncbi:Hypothetical protein CINCED_3A022780 [Cinara cedri]|uniref:CSN8/PSMD8/EIF3K domain-containing protein n=1 Tax=Cinara cedri TaxID=506608 RepID=A0A5E4MQL5_9HEMI|nr:Hypothetical protein CINCED_3A022780 [Cinara cedri]
MTKHTFLPTTNVEASQKEYLIARDILEVGVQCSIAMHDIPSFERYMAQLKCYYLDYRYAILNDIDCKLYLLISKFPLFLYRDKLPESVNQYHLLGLNLLFLLSQNRVAEFHTELELLPYDIVQTNTYIKHPVALEQYLMEGSYNKVINKHIELFIFFFLFVLGVIYLYAFRYFKQNQMYHQIHIIFL